MFEIVKVESIFEFIKPFNNLNVLVFAPFLFSIPVKKTPLQPWFPTALCIPLNLLREKNGLINIGCRDNEID